MPAAEIKKSITYCGMTFSYDGTQAHVSIPCSDDTFQTFELDKLAEFFEGCLTLLREK